jgi:hypothetical protein
VNAAVEKAVLDGDLWLVAGPTSLFKESIPASSQTRACYCHLPTPSLLPLFSKPTSRLLGKMGKPLSLGFSHSYPHNLERRFRGFSCNRLWTALFARG